MSHYVELADGHTVHLFDGEQEYNAEVFAALCEQLFVANLLTTPQGEPVCEPCIERENRIEAVTLADAQERKDRGFFE